MSIKITPADRWFSMCIREAADWTCECCGKKYEEKSMGLHCSHYFGRRNKSLRFCPDNAFAHCFGCHQKLGSNPDDFQRWMLDKVGEGVMDILREKRNDIGLAKSINKDLKGVAKHYKEEHARLQQLRMDGKVGILEITEY